MLKWPEWWEGTVRRSETSMFQAEGAEPVFKNPVLTLEPWTLTWSHSSLSPATVPAILNFSLFTTPCLCIISSVYSLFLFFLGWNHTSEPSQKVIYDPVTHPHTRPHSSWFFLLKELVFLTSLLPLQFLILIQLMSMWIVIDLSKILFPPRL